MIALNSPDLLLVDSSDYLPVHSRTMTLRLAQNEENLSMVGHTCHHSHHVITHLYLFQRPYLVMLRIHLSTLLFWSTFSGALVLQPYWTVQWCLWIAVLLLFNGHVSWKLISCSTWLKYQVIQHMRRQHLTMFSSHAVASIAVFVKQDFWLLI